MKGDLKKKSLMIYEPLVFCVRLCDTGSLAVLPLRCEYNMTRCCSWDEGFILYPSNKRNNMAARAIRVKVDPNPVEVDPFMKEY